MYYKDPTKSLVDGLYLITSSHDVISLIACHTGHVIMELYIVSFGNEGGDEEDSEENDEYGGRVELDDRWLADKLSDNEDLFDVDVDVGDGRGDGGAGPSNVQSDNPRVEQGNEYGKGGGDDESNERGDDDNEDDVDNIEASHDIRPISGENLKGTYEDVDDNDTNSEIGRSDILVSPVPSDEEGEISFARGSEFHAIDLGDPILKLEMKFSNIKTFRELVKVFNLKRGKDITFKRNERQKYIVVCNYPKCSYRVYVRQMPDEDTFQIRSIQSKCVW
jgi:hypothetical protein